MTQEDHRFDHLRWERELKMGGQLGRQGFGVPSCPPCLGRTRTRSSDCTTLTLMACDRRDSRFKEMVDLAKKNKG